MQLSRIRVLFAVAFAATATASSYAQPIQITVPVKNATIATSAIHVEHVPGPPVALLPSNRGGVVPLRVVFDVRHDLPSVTRFEADLDGNGSYEHVSAAVPESLEHTYTMPGLVVPACG
jgi:hypothetical protein